MLRQTEMLCCHWSALSLTVSADVCIVLVHLSFFYETSNYTDSVGQVAETLLMRQSVVQFMMFLVACGADCFRYY